MNAGPAERFVVDASVATKWHLSGEGYTEPQTASSMSKPANPQISSGSATTVALDLDT